MAWLKRLGFVLVAFYASNVVAQENPWLKLPHNLPKEVRAFMERRGQCNYWIGEGSTGETDRDAEILAHEKQLHCQTVGSDEIDLKKRYARNAQAIKAITESVSWIWN